MSNQILTDFNIRRAAINLKLWKGLACASSDSEEKVGFDVEGSQLTVTKNPYWKFRKDTAIIKHIFACPKVTLFDSMTAMAAAENFKDSGLCIVCADKHHYLSLCDQFILSGVEHWSDETNVKGRICISNRAEPNELFSHYAIYRYLPVTDIFCLNFDSRVYFKSSFLHQDVRIDLCEAIMSNLVRAIGRAVSPSWLQSCVTVHPKSLMNGIHFLIMSGYLKKVWPGTEQVIVEKRGEQPTDLEFLAIPTGTLTVVELMKKMMVDRRTVFERLKRWENKGLVFAYSARDSQPYYALTDKAFDSSDLKPLLEVKQSNDTLIKDISEQNGSLIVNRIIDERIQKHCMKNGTEAWIDDCFISPKSSSLGI